ncbi:MAG: hypothetical protein ACOY6E_10765 [Pseudomonadota bacterium]
MMRLSGRAQRLSWALLLAALFLAWQTGGLLHAVGHLSDDAGPDAPALPQHAACAQCLLHAGSDGVLAPSVTAPVLPPPVAAVPSGIRPAPTPARIDLPYQARAPPVPRSA